MLAVQLVADAYWAGEMQAPTEAMLAGFGEAARFALVPQERLSQQVQAGRCLSDPEAWFSDLTDRSHLAVERDRAARQCAGCPVQGQCLALDLITARGRVSWIHGIWGALGPRDRKQLQPLWGQLVARLRAQTGQTWRTRPRCTRSIRKGTR
jgi:WhiB family redox-sensing transcriptional regulator